MTEVAATPHHSYHRATERAIHLRAHRQEHRLLHMEPILRLVENRLGVRFERCVVDFLAAMRREAMHHERIGPRELHYFLIDPIRTELRFTPRFFAFLAHRNPDVGVKYVRTTHRFLEVRVADDVATS